MKTNSSNTCRVRKEIRTCKHPACGKKFEGSPTSLYCADHRTRKSRAERFIPKQVAAPEATNLTLEEDVRQPVRKTKVCGLEQCDRSYNFTVYPDHQIYPMYCELHRTEFKRRFFLQMVAKGKQPSYETLSYKKWGDYEVGFEEYALEQPKIEPFKKGNQDKEDWIPKPKE